MSNHIDKRAYLFQKEISEIFPGKTIENYSYKEYKDDNGEYCVRFNLVAGAALTFKQLGALSELLGTDVINFANHTEGYRYSSRTYDDGEPTSIECFKVQTKKP